MAINCAALVETLLEAELFGIEERTATGVRGRRGKFEHADGGTLFLDEVSDLSLSAQAKLLRAIQDLAVERVGGNGSHRVDIRIIAATNRSLAEMVERRLFRPDLFYRLGGVEICGAAAARAPGRHPGACGILPGAPSADAAARAVGIRARRARSYDWPGNVRELERADREHVALAPQELIELDDLPPAMRGDYEDVLLPSLTRDDTMRAWGSRYARLVLIAAAATSGGVRVLGISYHTLQAYLEYRERPGGPERVPLAAWPAGSEPENPDDRVAVES